MDDNGITFAILLTSMEEAANRIESVLFMTKLLGVYFGIIGNMY